MILGAQRASFNFFEKSSIILGAHPFLYYTENVFQANQIKIF